MTLHKGILLALATLAWNRGEASMYVKKAVVRLARASGLSGAELDDVRQALASPRSAGGAGLHGLSNEERILVYALAAWALRVEGETDEGEARELGVVGDRLGLGLAERVRGEAACAGWSGIAGS
jgi:hypothetical protein